MKVSYPRHTFQKQNKTQKKKKKKKDRYIHIQTSNRNRDEGPTSTDQRKTASKALSKRPNAESI